MGGREGPAHLTSFKNHGTISTAVGDHSFIMKSFCKSLEMETDAVTVGGCGVLWGGGECAISLSRPLFKCLSDGCIVNPELCSSI